MSEDTQPYQRLPSMDDETYHSLRTDISANGVEDPIHIDEDGTVIDGHHRVEICDELGIAEYPTKIHVGLTEQEKTDLAYKLNLQERHLSHGQKQELVEQYLEEDWDGDNSGEWYDDVATTLGVGKTTVGRAFKALKSGGKLSHLGFFAKGTKHQQVRDYIAENPNASNQTVADSVEVAVSNETVRNWRNEWEEGEDSKQDESESEGESSSPSFSTFSPTGSEEDREAAKRAAADNDPDGPPATDSSENSGGDQQGNDIEQFTSQQTDEWSSPREVVEPIAEAIGGFTLDPCSGAEQSPFADETFTEGDDGLARPWHGDVWVNPPYSDMAAWTEKAIAESQRDDVGRVVYLCKGDSSTRWWQSAIERAEAVCAIDGRLSFGDGGNAAPFASHIFVFGPLTDGLTTALREQGAVLAEIGGGNDE